jgi:hypothetical protein
MRSDDMTQDRGEPVALMDFATPEELEKIQGAQRERDAAETEARSLILKASELDAQAEKARRAADSAKAKRSRALVAEALGEGGATSPEAERGGPGPDEFKAAADELRRRAEEKRKEAEGAHGNLRALTLDLFRRCAQRAAGAYLETARRLEGLHANIGAAQMALNQAGVAPGELVSMAEWTQQFMVPTSIGLDALRNIGAEKHSAYRPPIAGGDEGRSLRAADAACNAVRAKIRALLGSWPLDRR